MITRSFLFFALFLLTIAVSGQPVNTAERYAIIPYPAQLEPRSGEFIFSRTTTVMVSFAQPDLKMLAESFAYQLNQNSGLAIPVVNINQTNSVGSLIQFLPLRDTTLSDEGYQLDVTEKLITIQANHSKGFFYAIQTLYQLMPPKVLSRGYGADGAGVLVANPPPDFQPAAHYSQHSSLPDSG